MYFIIDKIYFVHIFKDDVPFESSADLLETIGELEDRNFSLIGHFEPGFKNRIPKIKITCIKMS